MTAPLWLRPQSPLFKLFCCVQRFDGDSTISHCGGRWATSSTYVLIGVDVGKLECRGCRDALAAREQFAAFAAGLPDPGTPLLATSDPVSRDLSELRPAPAICTAELHTAPRDGVLFEGFDISDEEST